MMPRPPMRAMAMAIRDSVTVSIAAETSGLLMSISLVRRVVVEASEGMTSVTPGRRRTSSYVSPVRENGSFAACDSCSGFPMKTAFRHEDTVGQWYRSRRGGGYGFKHRAL